MELRLDCICIWMLGVGFARALELHLDGVAVADACGWSGIWVHLHLEFGCVWTSVPSTRVYAFDWFKVRRADARWRSAFSGDVRFLEMRFKREVFFRGCARGDAFCGGVI